MGDNMKFKVGDKLALNKNYKDEAQMYPIGLQATVLDVSPGTMYKVKLSTGETAEWSKALLEQVFVKKR